MRRTQEVRILIAALLLAGALLPAALATLEYEENIREQIFLVRPDNEFIPETTLPTYLANEDLIFFACLEEEGIPLRLSVVCRDNNEFQDIRAYKWGGENCYVGATNLEQFECTQAVVQAEYIQDEENLKLEQEIRINKFSKTLERVINTQFDDGGWQTPLDTAHGLFVLSFFPDLFGERIDQAIEYLKLNRNEEDKCWPADECRISTTANILFLLDKAGFEDLRIQHDGEIYLENTQNYLSGENWTVQIVDHTVNINASVNTSCVYDYDGSINTTTLNQYPDEFEFEIEPAHGNEVGVVCTEPVFVRVFDEFEENMLTYQGDNFTWDIPQPCWTKNFENTSCDIRATLHAISTGIDSTQRSQAANYLTGLLEEDRDAGVRVSNQTNMINDALFLHEISSSADEMTKGVLYRQANQGGWNVTEPYYEHAPYEVSDAEYNELQVRIEDRISHSFIATGYVVMALLENGYERDDEPLLDAERWVSLLEDEIDSNLSDSDLTEAEVAADYNRNKSIVLNDTKRNALAFYTLRNNARPLLLAEPRVLVMETDETTVDIINPTIFELEDIEFELSDSIDDEIEIEEKDYIGAYSFRRIIVRTIKEDPLPSNGYIRVGIADNEYFKLPVIIPSQPRINISLPRRITAFGSSAVLPFTVEKSSHNFNCGLEWTTEGIESTRTFNINNKTSPYRFPVRFNRLETENVVYEGTVTCSQGSTTFRIPIATNIVRFSNKPLEISPSLLSLDQRTSGQLQVTNALDQAIEVSAALQTADPFLSLSDTSFSLYPGESRNVTLEVLIGEGENHTATNRIVFTTFDIEEEVLVDVSVASPPGFEMPLWAWIVLIAALLAVLGVGGYFAYSKRDEILEWYREKFRKEDIEEKITHEVEKIEREEELIAIRNMIKILKMQGLGEAETRKRLINEGYTEEDIEAALALKEDKEEKAEGKQEKKES